MAGPTTAVLDDDIKELKASNQRIVDAIHLLEVTVTQRFGRMESEMEQRFSQVEVKMAEGFGDVRGEIKELRAEVRNVKGIGKWILGAVLTLLAGVGGAIWWASQIDYRVAQVEQRHKVEAPKR